MIYVTSRERKIQMHLKYINSVLQKLSEVNYLNKQLYARLPKMFSVQLKHTQTHYSLSKHCDNAKEKRAEAKNTVL